MPDLTLDDVKKLLVKILKWLGLILAILVLLFVLFRVGIFIKNALYPPEIPPAKVEFGILPPAFFSDSIKKDFTYEIDTLNGDLPIFEDKVNVYKIEAPEPDILAVDKANARIKSLGYIIGPEQLSETVYRWQSNDDLNRNLVLSVKSPEFNLSSAFLTNPLVLSARNFPSESDAILEAETLINALSLLPEDIDRTKTTTKLLDIKNGVIEDASSYSDAKLITVNFFQNDLENLPIVYPQADSSSMSVTVGSGGEVVDARFFYQKIGAESGSYPIKSAEEAYDQLKQGEAIVIGHAGNDLDILIKNIYLAYYIEGRQQNFLTPVVVFEGDNGFYAYVPAVKDEWIDK